MNTEADQVSTPNPIATELRLPCGVSLRNRVGKSAMTEGLADEYDNATPELNRLYQTWADGAEPLGSKRYV